MYELLETVFQTMIRYAVLLLECIGALIIVWSAIRSAIHLLRKQEGFRLQLAQGISLALEFKLGSEVLRTVIISNTEELIVTGAIVALRAAMTLLIHWEIKNEESHELKPAK